MVAEAGQRLAQSIGQYAKVQDAIDDKFDQETARSQGLQYKPEIAKLTTEFAALNGKNALEASAATQAKINKLREEALASASNPRMRNYLSSYLEGDFANALASVQGHAVKQLGVVEKTNASAELSLALDEAGASYADSQKFGPAIEKVKAAAGRRAQIEGLGDASAAYVKEQVGSVYAGAIANALASGDVDMASTMFEAHGDELTFDQRNAAFRSLQKPMQEREYGAIFAQATTGIPQTAPGGKFQMPVDGKVTSKFGEARGGEAHSGLDVAAPMGSAIRPIAGGKVSAVTEDGRAGKWVKVEHPDGTSSTYAHMGNQSVKVGDEVGPDTVLGTVGMTGHTTGPHVHLVVRDTKGNRVDPEKVIGGRYGAAKIVGTADAARNYDQASVIANIKKMGLPPEKERGAIDYALGEMARSERVYEDQQSDLGQRVNDWVGNYQASHGGEFPPPEALPSWASGWKGLPSLRGNLAEAQKAKRDKELAKQQDWTALNATLRMYNDPDGFMRADIPKEYIGKVSPSDYAQIVTAQAKMRAEASKPQAWNPFSETKQAFDNYILLNPPRGGKISDSEKAAALQTIKDAATDLAAKKGAPPTDSELYDIAARAMRKVQVPGVLWGTNEVSLYNVKTVPDADRNRIVTAFKNVYRRDPTPDEVLQWYRRQKAAEPR